MLGSWTGLQMPLNCLCAYSLTPLVGVGLPLIFRLEKSQGYNQESMPFKQIDVSEKTVYLAVTAIPPDCRIIPPDLHKRLPSLLSLMTYRDARSIFFNIVSHRRRWALHLGIFHASYPPHISWRSWCTPPWLKFSMILLWFRRPSLNEGMHPE